MAAAKFDLKIEAGATFKLALTVRQGATQASPAMNLTGWEPRMQVRPFAGALAVLLDCRPTNGRLQLTDAANGAVLLTIPADDTARLDAAGGVYDLLIRNTGTGEVRRLLQGVVTVDPAVTK